MRKTSVKRIVSWLIPAALLLAVCYLSLRLGSAALNSAEFAQGLLHPTSTAFPSLIVWRLRFPRLAGALIAGVGLALSGVLLQSVTDNDLAAPGTVGVNAGAGFAVILLLMFFPQAVGALPAAAFFGALAVTLLIVFLSSRIGMSKTNVLLAGVALSAVFNAGISFLSLLDSDVLSNYNYFSVGGVSGLVPGKLVLPAAMIAVCLFVALLLSSRIRLLSLGDEVASSLGVRVGLLRGSVLVLAAASAAAVVSFAGLLGFVGLIVPQISRRLVGSRTAPLILSSSLCGALLVALSDLLGRTLFAPTEIPVGILLSLLGAPFFFILLLSRRKRHAGME